MSDWERAYNRLMDKYANLMDDYDRLDREKCKLESEVRRLKPFEEASKKAYDRWALDGERGRNDKD